MRSFFRVFPVVLLLAFVPSLACAAFVWPAVYLETRLFSLWVVGLGVIVEFFFVRWLFRPPLGKAALATFVANILSAIGGAVLVPLAGMAWEFLAMWSYQRWLGWGSFNPLTWLVTLVLACLINTAVECLVYRFGFKFAVKRREVLWLLLANALSVGLAFGSLWLAPIEQY